MADKITEMLHDPEWLEDMLSTASYGSYWFGYSIHPDTPEEMYNGNWEYREQKWAHVLLNGGWLEIEDVEEEKSYKVGMAEIETGFRKLMVEEPQCYANIMEENYDQIDAENFIQVVLFGEVIYG